MTETNHRERPILFSGPMIRALLDGSKTQTRRAIRGQHRWPADGEIVEASATNEVGHQTVGHSGRWLDDGDPDDDKAIRCPYGVPGDRLWVREAWAYVGPGSGSDLPSYVDERARPENHQTANCWYAATCAHSIRWTPSIFMPRWASRITLEVVSVRVERLQQISEADAIAEGAKLIYQPSDTAPNKNTRSFDVDGASLNAPTAAEAYALLWDWINGTGSWDSNPFIWVIEFRRIA